MTDHAVCQAETTADCDARNEVETGKSKIERSNSSPDEYESRGSIACGNGNPMANSVETRGEEATAEHDAE